MEENNVLQNDRNGEVKVSNAVISVISGMALNEIEGVYSISEDKDTGNYSKKLLSKGISIEEKGEKIIVTVKIIVKYGYDVNEVARNVQLKVKDALENMIGFDVESVSIVVSGVHAEEEKSKETDKAESEEK